MWLEVWIHSTIISPRSSFSSSGSVLPLCVEGSPIQHHYHRKPFMFIPEFCCCVWARCQFWCPQRHHTVEFKNSRSSARFLSRCKKTAHVIQRTQQYIQNLQTHVLTWRQKDTKVTCLSFFDFFTFIFIFFPEIMLYLPPFFLSFKYWRTKKEALKRIKGEVVWPNFKNQ